MSKFISLLETKYVLHVFLPYRQNEEKAAPTIIDPEMKTEDTKEEPLAKEPANPDPIDVEPGNPEPDPTSPAASDNVSTSSSESQVARRSTIDEDESSDQKSLSVVSVVARDEEETQGDAEERKGNIMKSGINQKSTECITSRSHF